MRAALLALLLGLVPALAQADDTTALPGLIRQALSLPDGTAGALEALVIRPDGPGPFPLVLITHGMPRDAAAIAASRPQLYSGPAIGFAQRGYAAVVVMRRGYGHSGGPFAEGLGPCTNRDYVKSGEAAADDVLAALTALRTESWVDPSRMVLVGHSMGGFAAVAASARNPDGVRGIISFAGAVGSPTPDFVCQRDRLIDADQKFGDTAHIPSLWVFAENDHFFAPELAHAMFAAYTAHGTPASLFIAPPYGRDGHVLIWAPEATAWWPEVDAFLEARKLPTRIQVALPSVRHLAAPVRLDEVGSVAFVSYDLSRGYEKAFATDADGHYGVAYGQRTKTDAAQAAVKDCQREQRVCSVYAIGNELMSGADR
jgi:dienelactone hydrolase